MDDLATVRVAILVTDGFEQSELSEPRSALDKAGPSPVWCRPKVSTFGAPATASGGARCGWRWP